MIEKPPRVGVLPAPGFNLLDHTVAIEAQMLHPADAAHGLELLCRRRTNLQHITSKHATAVRPSQNILDRSRVGR